MKKYLVIRCKHCNEEMRIPLNDKFDFVVTDRVEENRIETTKELYLQNFIEKNFVLIEKTKPNERILRSEFKKMYVQYLYNNNAINRKMNVYEFNNFLKNKYGEEYIRSNGKIYLKKLILKFT